MNQPDDKIDPRKMNSDVDIPKVMKQAEQDDGYTDEDTIEMIEGLIEEFELTSVQFIFKPGKAEGFGTPWEYWMVTDHGPEFISSHHASFLEHIQPENYDSLPKALPLLIFLGQEPDEEVLEHFRTGRYAWHTLRSDVDTQTLFTQEGITTLWENALNSDPLFEPADLIPLLSDSDVSAKSTDRKRVPRSILRFMATGQVI